MDVDVAVVGAGISGLSTAHFLRNQGLDVCVIEASGRAGGVIQTERRGDFLIESGPSSILDTSEQLRQLIEDLDIANELEYANGDKRYIVRSGQLHDLPLKPPALLRSRLFSQRAKLRLLAEPLVRRCAADTDETVAEFARRRLGQEFVDYAVDPFVAGTFSGLPEELCVRAAFPKLYNLEQQYGSLIVGAVRRRREKLNGKKAGMRSAPSARLFSFKSGLQYLVDGLTAAAGSSLLLQQRVVAIRRYPGGFELECDGDTSRVRSRALLLTIPAHAYSQIRFEFDCAAAGPLSQVPYSSVAVLFFGYQRNPSAVPLDGMGFLVPRVENRQILGTIWNSAVFSGRAPVGGAALTTIVGGRRQPQSALRSDDELINDVSRELDELMGIKTAPDEIAITRWPRAIPQYTLSHPQFVKSLEQCEAGCGNLYLSGSFRAGISVADCVTRAHEMSARIEQNLSRISQEAVAESPDG